MAKKTRTRKPNPDPPPPPPPQADPYYPAPPAPPKQPEYGLECPKCGCTLFRVHATWGVRGAIRRSRVCWLCGWTTRTLEMFSQ